MSAEPVARRVLRFPLVVDAQTNTALDNDALEGWRRAAQAVSRPAPVVVEPPSQADPDDHTLAVTAGRLIERERASIREARAAFPRGWRKAAKRRRVEWLP